MSKNKHDYKKEDKDKYHKVVKAPESAHLIIAHCNVGINGVNFNN